MAKENSFDVVVETDRQEVDNALNQARKEIGQRVDFTGTGADLAWWGDEVVITANSVERAEAALGVLEDELVKRDVSLKALAHGDPEPAANAAARITVSFLSGVPEDKATALVSQIKASKLQVTPAIQGDKLRVSGKSKDALQQAQALLRHNDQGLPLRFTNYQ
jgi:uncharacterized protein YajQ (UPF0234 family)